MQPRLKLIERSSAGHWPVVVVGAGPAGLAVSARLAQARHPHVVLERGRVGESWRSQRWDSFRLNTPLWMNRAAGPFRAGEPGSFGTAGSLVAALDRLAEELPVHEDVAVLRARPTGATWELETTAGRLTADDLVVASGFQNVPRTLAFAAELPARLRQLHVGEYRRPDEVEGAVLVVGGGQSGLQVAEDLLRGGRRVFLSTSRVGRMPRRYRGRDAAEWLHETGQLDLPTHRADPAAVRSAPPQVSGTRTVSYQRLAGLGATLLGRAKGWDGQRLTLAADLGANVRFADQASARFRSAWDEHAARASLTAAHDPDPADEPATHLYGHEGPSVLDLEAAGISTIVWATGFGPSTEWLPPASLDANGRAQLPHLHAIGAPWLTHRMSAGLYGMAADADRLAETLTAAELPAAA
jgi:putative flavoprotein involved in K+ transport